MEKHISKQVCLLSRDSTAAFRTDPETGLFDPGDLPHPTMETFTKDMEPWERTTPGVKTFEKNLC